jgi:hypothetical protein
MVLNDDEVRNIISEKMEIVLQIGKEKDSPEINTAGLLSRSSIDICLSPLCAAPFIFWSSFVPPTCKNVWYSLKNYNKKKHVHV